MDALWIDPTKLKTFCDFVPMWFLIFVYHEIQKNFQSVDLSLKCIHRWLNYFFLIDLMLLAHRRIQWRGPHLYLYNCHNHSHFAAQLWLHKFLLVKNKTFFLFFSKAQAYLISASSHTILRERKVTKTKKDKEFLGSKQYQDSLPLVLYIWPPTSTFQIWDYVTHTRGWHIWQQLRKKKVVGWVGDSIFLGIFSSLIYLPIPKDVSYALKKQYKSYSTSKQRDVFKTHLDHLIQWITLSEVREKWLWQPIIKLGSFRMLC